MADSGCIVDVGAGSGALWTDRSRSRAHAREWLCRYTAVGVTWGTDDQASAGAELVINVPAALPGGLRDILDRVR